MRRRVGFQWRHQPGQIRPPPHSPPDSCPGEGESEKITEREKRAPTRLELPKKRETINGCLLIPNEGGREEPPPALFASHAFVD